MTRRKQMIITTCLYAFCAVVWTANFFITWHNAGTLETSTVLFAVSAVCFGIAAVLNIIRIRRMKKED